MAIELKKLLESRRQYEVPPGLDLLIKKFTQEFVKYHHNDFGIELAWPAEDPGVTARR